MSHFHIDYVEISIEKILSIKASYHIVLSSDIERISIDPNQYTFYPQNGTIFLHKSLDKGWYDFMMIFSNFNITFETEVCGPWTIVYASESKRPSYLAMAFAFIIIFIFVAILLYLLCCCFALCCIPCFVGIEE